MGPLVPEQTGPHRLQPGRQNLDVDDGDETDFPDDSSVGTSAELDDNRQVGAEVQLVDGVNLQSNNRHLHTLHPVAVDGHTEAHVVLASRQPIPDDVPVVVVPHNVSPFAASNLQIRSSSFASD